MNEYYSYITQDNDRWDLIAYKFYGDATKYERIIAANPKVKITPTLMSGIELKIPVAEQEDTIKFILPPWRQ